MGDERSTFTWLWALGFLAVILGVFWGVFRQQWMVFLGISNAFGLLPCGAVAFIKYRRMRVQREAIRMMADDLSQYDARWGDILRDHEPEIAAVEREALKIQALVEQRCASLVQAEGSQKNVRSFLSSSGPQNAPPSFSSQPNQSLSVVYGDAKVVYRSFQAWVADLADRSGGEHKPSGLKKVKRALEKVRRVYADDASRLGDVVRASIIFEEPSELAKCLQLVAQEEPPKVCRIKNRLAKNFDSATSMGYRDVSLNVRWELVNGSWHICELQLQLCSLFELKSDGGHKRYVLWRNGRGE